MVSRAGRDGLDEHRLRCSSRELEDKTADKASVRRCITRHCGVEAHVIFHPATSAQLKMTERVAVSSWHSRRTRLLRVECAGFRHQMAHQGSPGAAAISRQSRRAVKRFSGYRRWERFWGDKVHAVLGQISGPGTDLAVPRRYVLS